MASKSKQARLKAANRRETATLSILFSVAASTLAFAQNRYGQFTDVREFFTLHFADGLHHWPFSTHQVIGAAEPIHPVEYPALTGLIMWILSFFIEPSPIAKLDYFRLTAVFHIALFAVTA